MLAKRFEGARQRESPKMSAVRVGTPLPHRAVHPATAPPPASADVRTRGGRVLSNVSFAKLVEMIITGELVGEDEIAMAGQPFTRVEAVDVLARHLPPSTATTSRLDGPGVPDYAAELPATTMLEVLSWLLAPRETGVLFADRPASAPPSEPRPRDDPPSSRAA